MSGEQSAKPYTVEEAKRVACGEPFKARFLATVEALEAAEARLAATATHREQASQEWAKSLEAQIAEWKARAETYDREVTRLLNVVCAAPACTAVIVRRDDGSRVCAAGHPARWVNVDRLTEAEAERDALAGQLQVLRALVEESHHILGAYADFHTRDAGRLINTSKEIAPRLKAALASTSATATEYLNRVKAEAEAPWRRMLWLRHGCIGLYGDDGEMQCGACLLDFKRMNAGTIEARFTELGLRALATSQEPTK